jgi:mitotic spindle assembly checkpoint protein MAD2B
MSQPPRTSKPSVSPQPETVPPLIPLSEAHALITTFATFLTVSIHNILFYRNLYPATTFLSARAYNLPVHQNRHPKVCSWIQDAVDAVAGQLADGNVERAAVVVHAPLRAPPQTSSNKTRAGNDKGKADEAEASHLPPGSVLERWMFDVSRFPSWPGGADAMREYGNAIRKREEDDDEEAVPAAGEEEDDPLSGDDGIVAGDDAQKINWTDVEEQFRAVLRRLSYAAEGLEALPTGCTFTVAVELREEGRAPIGVSYAYNVDQALNSQGLTTYSIHNRGFRHNRVCKRPRIQLETMWSEPRQCLSDQ